MRTVLSPLTFISPTVGIFMFFLYSCFRKTYDYINLFFEYPSPYHPFIYICELYMVFVILIFFLSFPSFFIFFWYKKPMNSPKNFWMIKRNINYFLKIGLVCCAPFNKLVFVPLSIYTVDMVFKKFKKRSV